MVKRKTSDERRATNCPVAVVMGSDSDMQVMQACVDTLSDFGIRPVVRIISAHRTPQIAAAFAENAARDGIKVIIAGAGMAAHLAGALAAHTTLPVIGVPLASTTRLGGLNGVDALLSTVQMPPGVPVATMAIGKAGAKNAAILAVQILALSDSSRRSAKPEPGDSLARKRLSRSSLRDSSLRDKLADFKNAQRKNVIEKDAALPPKADAKGGRQRRTKGGHQNRP